MLEALISTRIRQTVPHAGRGQHSEVAAGPGCTRRDGDIACSDVIDSDAGVHREVAPSRTDYPGDCAQPAAEPGAIAEIGIFADSGAPVDDRAVVAGNPGARSGVEIGGGAERVDRDIAVRGDAAV